MNCKNCHNQCVKNGVIKTNGKQRYYCKACAKSFVETYTYQAYQPDTNTHIVKLLKESCGTRSIARLLHIAPKTVTNRILHIARHIKKPPVPFGKTYEMDEMITYIHSKNRRICIAYAIDQSNKSVVDFVAGRRNKTTLRQVVNTLLLSDAQSIHTDRLNLYRQLIPKPKHRVKNRGINHIERKNLTLRTHLKRLNRKTIAYSKSLSILSAILKIYFWY